MKKKKLLQENRRLTNEIQLLKQHIDMVVAEKEDARKELVHTSSLMHSATAKQGIAEHDAYKTHLELNKMKVERDMKGIDLEDAMDHIKLLEKTIKAQEQEINKISDAEVHVFVPRSECMKRKLTVEENSGVEEI